jgi:hypothetical protein
MPANRSRNPRSRRDLFECSAAVPACSRGHDRTSGRSAPAHDRVPATAFAEHRCAVPRGVRGAVERGEACGAGTELRRLVATHVRLVLRRAPAMYVARATFTMRCPCRPCAELDAGAGVGEPDCDLPHASASMSGAKAKRRENDAALGRIMAAFSRRRRRSGASRAERASASPSYGERRTSRDRACPGSSFDSAIPDRFGLALTLT